MEQSLLKTNFIGRDGFLWWIGQVAPEGAQKDQLDKGGWGNRRNVPQVMVVEQETMELV